jgi:serine/threonine protein kinase
MLRIDRNVMHFNNSVTAHRAQVLYSRTLEDDVHDMVWDYLRSKARAPIPAPDYEMPPITVGAEFDGFTIGKVLGKGSCGTVYKLLDSEGTDDSNGQVMKTVLKKPRTSWSGFKEIKTEIEVMKALSSSKWLHANIIRLHEVYHSQTQLVYRMEDGGLRNLYTFLKYYETKQLPLGTRKAKSILTQCKEALCHMHLGPKIVHRDIKPENIMIAEAADGVKVKLCDFDLAQIMQKKGTCKAICGTYPFMAPDVMHGEPHDPFAADIWSLAVVFLEVLCRLQVLTKVIHNGRLPPRHSHDERVKMTLTIGNHFEQPKSVQNLFEAHIRPELKEHLLGPMVTLLGGMMIVDVAKRWTAKRLAAVPHLCKVVNTRRNSYQHKGDNPRRNSVDKLRRNSVDHPGMSSIPDPPVGEKSSYRRQSRQRQPRNKSKFVTS